MDNESIIIIINNDIQQLWKSDVDVDNTTIVTVRFQSCYKKTRFKTL